MKLNRTISIFLTVLTLLSAGCVSSPASSPTTTTATDSTTPFHLKLVADGFTSPVGLVSPNDGTGRLFVVDQAGLIYVITADGKVLETPFLDLRPKMVALSPAYDERGVLGLAFHPAFKQNGRFFVYYTAPLRNGVPAGWNCTARFAEFHVSANNLNQADVASERIILEIDKPQSNHNGATIVFGPDGFLYLSMGDGGGANDVALGHAPGGNGQDTSTLLGKILRIDVNGAPPYAIPADNPDLGAGARREIFAFGFRNPFRIAFDAGGNHELFASDAGQNLWEEIDIVTKGGNYGWHLKEGTHAFDPASPLQSPPQTVTVDARGRPLIDPIIEYANAATPGGGIGRAVVGGFIYRGHALPALNGAYIFGDYSAGQTLDGKLFVAVRPSPPQRLWSMRPVPALTADGKDVPFFLRSFGQDDANEVYVLTTETPGPSGKTGKVFKIVP